MPYKDPQKQKEARKKSYLNKKNSVVDNLKFPPIKISENIKETQYSGYYVRVDGNVYRKPGKYDRHTNLNEYGLILMNTHLRGNPKHTKYCYPSINITLRDKNGKFLQQKKVNVHRLVAETFISNPNNLSEVDHIDRNRHNNSVSNLRWVSRIENMSWNAKPFYFCIIDTRTGKVYKGENNLQWIRENWNWISLRTKMKQVDFISYFNYRKKANGLILQKYEKT